MAGSQDYAPDPRNQTAGVWLNGAVVPREEAKVSIFDAGFTLGDGVWEGIRLHKGALVFLDAHLERLFAGATRIGLEIGMDREEIRAALRALLEANAMEDGVHIRLMVTRGLKATVNQDPRNALGKPTVAITAEYKAPAPHLAVRGLSLFVVSVRCTPATMFDMRLNSHSRLNLITALLEAIAAGADEALMLDPHGFVSSCNATNFFFVRDGEVLTSTGDYCFHGITRRHVIELCHAHAIPIRLTDSTLSDLGRAQEAFVTGTTGGVIPVREIDGVRLPEVDGPLTRRLRALYVELMDAEAVRRGRW